MNDIINFRLSKEANDVADQLVATGKFDHGTSAAKFAFAYAVAEEMGNFPLVFAKKSKSATVGNDVFTAEVKSFTRNIVSKITVANKYLKPSDTVLIVDDFLAEGNASLGLVDLCKQAGAKVVGVAVAIEKGFQGGRNRLEALGLKVYSAADVKAFVNNKPVF